MVRFSARIDYHSIEVQLVYSSGSKYLYLGCRTLLINSVLDALPTYVMSLFSIPSREEVGQLEEKVLVTRKFRQERLQLSGWNIVIKSKRDGVMGIKNLKLHNKYLLSKLFMEICLGREQSMDVGYQPEIWRRQQLVH